MLFSTLLCLIISTLTLSLSLLLLWLPFSYVLLHDSPSHFIVLCHFLAVNLCNFCSFSLHFLHLTWPANHVPAPQKNAPIQLLATTFSSEAANTQHPSLVGYSQQTSPVQLEAGNHCWEEHSHWGAGRGYPGYQKRSSTLSLLKAAYSTA